MVKEDAKRRQDRGLLAVIWMFWFAMYTYPAFFAPYLRSLNASPAEQGVIIGSYGFAQMMLRLPFGILSDRLGRRRIFVAAGLVASLISGFGLAFTTSLPLILLLRGLTGVSAAMWVQLTSLYFAGIDPERRADASGHISALQQFSTLTAMLIGSWLAERVSFPAAFALGGLAATAGLLLMLLERRRTPEEVKPAASATPAARISWAVVARVATDPMLFWSAVISLLMQLVQFATIQGFVPQLAADLGASPGDMGLLSALTGLSRALVSIWAGSFARRLGLRRTLVIAILLAAFCTALLPVMPNFAWLIVNQMLAALGVGLLLGLLLGLCVRDIEPQYRTSGMGFYQSVYAVGMVAGPVLTGWLAGRSTLAVAFRVIAVIALLTALLTAWKMPKETNAR
ncbi:MAG: MFS transporter [Bacillota bacterium]|nr:MFS transporter [Bacillota bacterium]